MTTAAKLVRRGRKKPYICYACRDGHCSLCAFDLDPKKPCNCDKIWHVELKEGKVRRFKGTVVQ